MRPLDKFKEVLKERNLDHDDYFVIAYAAIDLRSAATLDGMDQIRKIYEKK